jgi:hypothetical protein
MSCVLRASGAEFDAAAYLADSPFRRATVYGRGDPAWAGAARGRASAGFNVSLGEDDGGGLAAQIDEAIEFLDLHEDELRRLGRFPGVEEVEIDFAIEWRDAAMQTDCFPPELLWRAGALDIGLRVTHYVAQRAES